MKNTLRAELVDLLDETDSHGRTESPLQGAVDRLVRLACLAVHAPSALVALQRRNGSWFTVATGVPSAWMTSSAELFFQAISQRAITAGKPVTASRVGQELGNDGDAWLLQLGAATWAAVPLSHSDENLKGVLCVIDTSPRDWTNDQLQALDHIGALTVALAELREAPFDHRSSLGGMNQSDAHTHGDGLDVYEHSAVRAPQRVYGVVQEIANQEGTGKKLRETEAELRFQQSLLLAQSEASVDGILVVSRAGEILSHNHRFVEMWGIPEEVMSSGSDLKALQAVLDKLTDPDGFVQRVHELYERPDEVSHDEILLKDGRTFERHSAPVNDSHGVHFGRLWQFRDVTDKKRSEKQLLEQTARLESLVLYSPDVVAELDLHGVYRTVNPAITSIIGYQPEELVGKPFTAITDSKHHVPAWEEISRIQQGSSPSLDLTVRHREGHSVEVSVQGIPIILDGEIIGFWTIGRDITETKRITAQLQRSEANLAAAQRIAGLGSWEWDIQANLLNWSEETYRILGVDPDRVTPTFDVFIEAIHPDDRQRIRTEVAASLNDGVPYDIEMTIVRPDGGKRTIRAQGEVAMDEQGEPAQMVGTVLDITERKLLEKALAYRADHDPLTGLANRYALNRRIEHILTHSSQGPDSVGLLFIDLDDFKAVNDSLGHDAGDELLIRSAQVLAESVREDDTVARLGGDEFIVLLEHVTSQDELIQLAERIVRTLSEPLSIQGVTLSVSPSIGIVPAIEPDQSAESALQDADVAMYWAKEKGKACYEVFTPDMRRNSQHRIAVQDEL